MDLHEGGTVWPKQMSTFERNVFLVQLDIKISVSTLWMCSASASLEILITGLTGGRCSMAYSLGTLAGLSGLHVTSSAPSCIEHNHGREDWSQRQCPNKTNNQHQLTASPACVQCSSPNTLGASATKVWQGCHPCRTEGTLQHKSPWPRQSNGWTRIWSTL